MLSNFYIPIFEYFDDPITNLSVVGPGLMRCWGSVGSVNSSQIRLNNPTQAERSNPLSKFPKLTYLILLRNWHGNIFKKYNDNSTKQTVFFLSFQNLYISSLHLTKRSLAIKNKKKPTITALSVTHFLLFPGKIYFLRHIIIIFSILPPSLLGFLPNGRSHDVTAKPIAAQRCSFHDATSSTSFKSWKPSSITVIIGTCQPSD